MILVTLQRYSQSHRLLSYRPFPKIPAAGTTPRSCSPIDGFTVGTVEWWNSTSQIMERAGTMRPAALWIALLVASIHQTQVTYWTFQKSKIWCYLLMTYYFIKSTVCNLVPINCEAKCEKEKVSKAKAMIQSSFSSWTLLCQIWRYCIH